MSDAGEIARGPGEMMGNAGPGMLAGLRVIEVADERAEYTGLLLAGLGAEVVKVEPPEGNATRRIGPFLEDEPGLERSLFFWNYNRNKKSVVLDLRETLAREHMLRLLEGADVMLDVLSRTAVIPPAFVGKFQKIKSGDYTPEFPLRLMSKDMDLAMNAARSSGAVLPAATAAQSVLASNISANGDLDLAAITPFVIGQRANG